MTDYEAGTDPREDRRTAPGESEEDIRQRIAEIIDETFGARPMDTIDRLLETIEARVYRERLACAAERDALRARVAALEAERAAPPVSMGQRRLEALLRAARVYESHDMAMAAPEVQAAIREMAPLVERDPVREMAMRIFIADDMSPVDCARTAVDVLATIDAELARLRTARTPPIK